MIKCNLSTLLAARGIKITKASKDTGISRTTLTSLAFEHAKGIQYDTLNTLCTYLKVTPDRILSFWPVDLSYELSLIKHKEKYEEGFKSGKVDYDLAICFSAAGKSEKFKMRAEVTYLLHEKTSQGNDTFWHCIESDIALTFDEDHMGIDGIFNATRKMKSVPEEFLFSFRKEICDEIEEEFQVLKSSDYHVINWPFDRYE